MKNNDEKMRTLLEQAMPDVLTIKDLLDEQEIMLVDLMRVLFLVKNVKTVSKWGKVTINVKEGEVTSIQGENTFITERELVRNINKYRNR